MLTAIGRAAARGALLRSRSAAPRIGLVAAAQLLRGPANQANVVLALARSRTLSDSARLLAPAKGTSAAASKAKKTKAAAAKKKPAAKKKTAAAKKKKKKPAAKKKPANKAKKTLTPEQKEKAELKKLKQLALLKRPTYLPDSAWSVYVADNITPGGAAVSARIKGIAQDFAKISDPDKDRLQARASANQLSNKETRQKWIKSFPPEAIYLANLARRRLGRKLDKPRVYLVHDDRQPKRARSALSLFVMSRFPQVKGDKASMTDAFRSVVEEWKALPESEKQPYKDEAAKEAQKSQALFKAIRDKAKAYIKAEKEASG